MYILPGQTANDLAETFKGTLGGIKGKKMIFL